MKLLCPQLIRRLRERPTYLTKRMKLLCPQLIKMRVDLPRSHPINLKNN
jgi:hypothetical protein